MTLVKAVGETKAPGAGPRYTSNTLVSPGNKLACPRAIGTVTTDTPAGSITSCLVSVKCSVAEGVRGKKKD